MAADFISMVGIAVGIVLFVLGLVLKKVTKHKVSDLDGFMGIIEHGKSEDGTEQENDEREETRK